MEKLLKIIYGMQPFKIGDYVYALKWSMNDGYKLSKTKYKINRISLSLNEYNIKYDCFYDTFVYSVGKKKVDYEGSLLFFNKNIGLKIANLLNKISKDDGFNKEYCEERRRLIKEDRDNKK